MVEVQAAVVREQGLTFAVVAVKASALTPACRATTHRQIGRLFPAMPIVLMAREGTGRPSITAGATSCAFSLACRLT